MEGTPISDPAQVRSAIVDFLRRELIGPDPTVGASGIQRSGRDPQAAGSSTASLQLRRTISRGISHRRFGDGDE